MLGRLLPGFDYELRAVRHIRAETDWLMGHAQTPELVDPRAATHKMKQNLSELALEFRVLRNNLRVAILIILFGQLVDVVGEVHHLEEGNWVDLRKGFETMVDFVHFELLVAVLPETQAVPVFDMIVLFQVRIAIQNLPYSISTCFDLEAMVAFVV